MNKSFFQVSSIKKLYAKHKVYIDGMIAIVFIAIIFHQTPIELLVRLLDNVNDLDFKFVSVFQNLSLALLTVLIPIGIAIFQIVDERPKFKILQRRVLLSKVFSLNKLIFTVPFLFLPFVMWKIIYLRSFMVLLWAMGVFFVMGILVKLSRWMADDSEFKFKKTINYLEELNGEDELSEAFDAIWDHEHPYYPFEERYFNVFKNRINHLIKSPDEAKGRIVSSLLGDFFSKLELRTLSLMIYGSVIEDSLRWYSIALEYKNNKHYKYWISLTNSFGVYIKQLYMKLFKSNQAYYFFEKLKEWADNKNTKIQVVESFFEDLIEDDFLIQVMDNDAWFEFPNEWLIKSENIEGLFEPKRKEDKIRSVIFRYFMNKASSHLLFGKGEFDEYLEELNKELFPEVEPITWSYILVIRHAILYQRDGKGVIELALDTRKGFGCAGRMRSYWVKDEKSYLDNERNETEKTFKFSLELFSDVFNLTKLEQLESELETFKDHANYYKYKTIISGLKSSKSNKNFN